jgi:S1-C subfamily serine protease
VALGVLAACAACANESHPSAADGVTSSSDATTADVQVVSLEAQGCDRPQRRLGNATMIDENRALTAAHLVEGPLRVLEIDGEPAQVVAIDVGLDVALVATGNEAGQPDGPTPFVPGSSYVEGPVDIILADEVIRVPVVRAVTLRVDDVTDGVVYERPALELDAVVDPGDSGSPVVDTTGRMVGVIALRRPVTGVSYATRVDALDGLLASATLVRDGLAIASPCP